MKQDFPSRAEVVISVLSLLLVLISILFGILVLVKWNTPQIRLDIFVMVKGSLNFI